MKLLALGLLAGALGFCAIAEPLRRGAEAAQLVPSAPPDEAALRALTKASACKRELVGHDGARRELLRDRAIAAYRAVYEDHPSAPRVGAEAAYRSGELLRAANRTVEAEAAFGTAIRLGKGTPFRARGGLELGHIARRAGRLDAALDAYERVRGDDAAELEHRHEATWWAGRVHGAQGRIVDAARLFQRVALDAEDPLDQLRAYDAWAMVLIDAGDLEGAAGVLERCRVALLDRTLEETRFGQRVRAAFEGLRARELLERAVAKRHAHRMSAPEMRVERDVLAPAEHRTPPLRELRSSPSDRMIEPSRPPHVIQRMGTSSQHLFPRTGS